jgi:endo-1,4-beta-xylanase
MKRTMVMIVACLALTALAGCVTMPKEEKSFPKPEGQIAEAVWGTPSAIDGTLDPVFANAKVIATSKETMGDTAATAKARMAWDYEYLYVFFEVKDPKLSDVNSNPWEKDSIEVFIDEKNSKTDAYEEGHAQYRVNYKNEVTVGTGGKLEAVKSGAKVVDGGYNVTIAVPFQLGEPVAGAYIGFDIQVNDDDGSGVRTGQRNWCDDTNNGWRIPAVFGNLHLRIK